VEEEGDVCHVPIESVACTGQLGGNYMRLPLIGFNIEFKSIIETGY
jgi:hypothetical protein